VEKFANRPRPNWNLGAAPFRFSKGAGLDPTTPTTPTPQRHPPSTRDRSPDRGLLTQQDPNHNNDRKLQLEERPLFVCHETRFTLPSPVPNLTYIFVRLPCYPFLVVPSTKGANHGMDRTEARRDRPQLRNQLVRQRRALIEFHFLRLPLSASKPAAAAF
jgi:hypothetical protein